jgi:hypothetical protein
MTPLGTDVLVIEHVYTRDAVVPLVEGNHDFIYGWQCIPQRPSPDGRWEIFDLSKDDKTGWRRIRIGECSEDDVP